MIFLITKSRSSEDTGSTAGLSGTASPSGLPPGSSSPYNNQGKKFIYLLLQRRYVNRKQDLLLVSHVEGSQSILH